MMKGKPWTHELTALGAACMALALGLPPSAAQGAPFDKSACSCINPKMMDTIYAVQLRMAPEQAATKHCAVAPTFLDFEQTKDISVRRRQVATGQRFARGVVNVAPEVSIGTQLLVYIDSNPNYPMATCEVKSVFGRVTLRDDKTSITHQEAEACMKEIQESRTWKELCVGDVLKTVE